MSWVQPATSELDTYAGAHPVATTCAPYANMDLGQHRLRLGSAVSGGRWYRPGPPPPPPEGWEWLREEALG